MKLAFTILVLFLFSIKFYSQTIPEDFVISLKKDTLYGSITIKHDMAGYARVVLHKNGKKKKFDRYTSLGFRKDGQLYESLKINGVPEFYSKLIEGNLTLYVVTQLIVRTNTQHTISFTNVSSIEMAQILKCCFKKNGNLIVPTNHKELSSVFIDYNELYLKVLNREITDIKYMVTLYNDWFNKKGN